MRELNKSGESNWNGHESNVIVDVRVHDVDVAAVVTVAVDVDTDGDVDLVVRGPVVDLHFRICIFLPYLHQT